MSDYIQNQSFFICEHKFGLCWLATHEAYDNIRVNDCKPELFCNRERAENIIKGCDNIIKSDWKVVEVKVIPFSSRN